MDEKNTECWIANTLFLNKVVDEL